MLGELGEEVQGVEDLEVAGDAVEEVRARRPGESPARSLLGEVDQLGLLGDADQSLETERASEHVVGDALASGEVVGVQPHRMMHAEARVIPAEHLRDERLVDLAVLQCPRADPPTSTTTAPLMSWTSSTCCWRSGRRVRS